jgi:hypothetical protein
MPICVQKLKIETAPHQLYSIHFMPSNFSVSVPLKTAYWGNKFKDDTDLQNVIHNWLQYLNKNNFISNRLYEHICVFGIRINALKNSVMFMFLY